ncbi:unnamed protein product [Pedinophyceae sp. YPF-701]|nr:unnamed protein product [Pedinophyceae sp. YPF-701]
MATPLQEALAASEGPIPGGIAEPGGEVLAKADSGSVAANLPTVPEGNSARHDEAQVAPVVGSPTTGGLGVAPSGRPQSPSNGAPDFAKHDASLHGEGAARRRAIQELLFFASAGDVKRCQKLRDMWKLDLKSPDCCDYDKRTPLHLAASEGAWTVTRWLLAEGADYNALDRFKRTPLEDAVRGEYVEVAKLLIEAGGCIFQRGKLLSLADSELAGLTNLQALGLTPGFEGLDLDPEWEIEPSELHVLEKIGQGEFGTVFKAKWRGSYVAVKVLNSSDQIALGDFRTEIGILRRVHHPNAVQMLGACTKKKPYMLVTEFVPGGSLADVFRMQGALTVRRVVEIALDIARGMAYLHANSKSIIHRDLKPSNILIGGSYYNRPDELAFHTGIIKIGDFGLSKSLPVFDVETLTDAYQLTGGTGSYRYMAPEVFKHEPYNNKVDVYSFGMILYQLVEGVVPYYGTKPIQAAYDAAQRRYRPPWRVMHLLPKGAQTLKVVSESCWHEDPGMRPTFEQIIDALEELVATMADDNPSWLYQKYAPPDSASKKSKGSVRKSAEVGSGNASANGNGNGAGSGGGKGEQPPVVLPRPGGSAAGGTTTGCNCRVM